MDDRARVPFALLGVLLLVSSATLTATIDPARPPTDSETEVVVERATATTQTALREAVSTASRAAAANPVIEPANTTVGRVLNDSSAFRDALRLRIYVAARERLADVTVRQDDITGTVSLPATDTEAQLRAAKRRVVIERADGNGTAIRATIENVTVRSRVDGQVRSETTISPTVVVATPVLAAHERVQAYQQRLDAGITKPGLSQRLTAQLYALAWTRGYSQYGGAPIDNVVSNQHVGVATNAALLQIQRATIGHSDPRGRRTLSVATLRTVANDATAATGQHRPILQELLGKKTGPTDSEIQGIEPPEREGPGETRRIGVNDTADAAFLGMLDNDSIATAVESAYSIELQVRSNVEGDRRIDPTPPASPGENWTKVGQRRNVTEWSRDVIHSPPTVPEGWHAFETDGRQYVQQVTIHRTWERQVAGPNGTTETVRRTTSATTTTRENVSVVVVGRHDRTSPAPNRSVRTAHERGAGPLDGPNLAGARDAAIDQLMGVHDQRSKVLKQAARREIDDTVQTVALDRPSNVSEWIYRDLMTLRERVRDVHITVEQGGLGSFRVNPPAVLADRLQQRRAELLDAPRSYDSAATKARIAARAIYLNRVERRLRTLAEQRRDQSGAFEESIENSKASMTNLTEGLEARERPTPDRQPRISGVGGELRLTADAAPAYLTQAQLTHDQIPAIDGRSYPLAARNTNVFSVPYQTAADTVVDGLFGTNGDVSLQAAANELNATNRTLSGINDSVVFRDTSQMNVSTEEARALEKRASKVGELQGRRRALKEGVVESTNHLIEGQQNVLEARGIGSDDARSSMLVDAFAPWTTIHSQALALVNGTVTRRLTAIAARRANLSVVERDRLAIRLNETLERNMTEGPARPSLDTVNKSRSATHKVARQLARDAAGKIAERGTKRLYRDAMERSFSAMPAGVPLAPVPGYWYATMNVWHVEVRGQYARFGVRASQGRPTTPGGEFVYARDGDRVTLDVDGDGTGERLGRSTKVDFYASSTIMVVVPPGKTGVGDTNGVMIEQSKGWTRTDGE